MSRNQKRIAANQAAPTTRPPIPDMPKTQESSNPFGLSFVVNKEIVKLPSAGNFYSENSPLSGLESVEIKAMTAKEEDIIMNESFVNEGTVFNRLIDSIVTTPGVLAKDMQDCDKMAILLHARKTGYGDGIELSVICDHCDHKFETAASISKILEQSTASSEEGDWTIEEGSGLVCMTLPMTDIKVKIKVLTPEDREHLRLTIKKKKQLNIECSETVEFLRKVIISANDVVDEVMINQLCEVIPTSDVRKITKAHNSCTPSMDMVTNITCPSCNADLAKEVPFSLGWFWSE